MLFNDSVIQIGTLFVDNKAAFLKEGSEISCYVMGMLENITNNKIRRES